jgi:WD repeat-containing protein 61
MIIEKKTELNGHIASIYALAVAAGNNIYSGGADKHVVRWSLENLNDATIIAKTPQSVYALSESPDHQLLFIGTSAGNIHITNLKHKEEIKILKNHEGKVYDLKIHKNRLYSAGEDGCITITDLSSLSTVQVIKVSQAKIRSVDFKDELMCLASGDGYIRFLNLGTMEPLREIAAHEKAANVVKFHPYKEEIISGGWDAYLKIWRYDLALLKSIPAHNYAIYSIVFSPDGQLMATGSRDKTIKLWRSSDIDLPHTIDFQKQQGHQYSVNKLLWHPHANLLISAGDDKKLMCWEIKNYY